MTKGQRAAGLLKAAVCGLILVFPTVSLWSAQASSPMPRVAAVRYAIASGWDLAEPNTIVIVESTLGAVSGRPVPQTEALRDQEAGTIAKLLGQNAVTGRARDYLVCPSLGICFTAPGVNSRVLVVNGLFVGHNDILIRLYLPPSLNDGRDAMTMAIVDLNREAEEWTGTRFAQAPKTLIRRR